MVPRVLCLVLCVAACGGRCKDVESARAASSSRTGAPDRGADLRITLPFAQLDRVFAEQLAAVPLTVAATVGMTGDRLVATATDRDLETVSANPVLELGATVKFFLFGWIDQSKDLAAHTVLRVGGRTLATRVTSAALEHGELRFGIAFGAPPEPQPASR